jgi:hypothetical protein
MPNLSEYSLLAAVPTCSSLSTASLYSGKAVGSTPLSLANANKAAFSFSSMTIPSRSVTLGPSTSPTTNFSSVVSPTA